MDGPGPAQHEGSPLPLSGSPFSMTSRAARPESAAEPVPATPRPPMFTAEELVAFKERVSPLIGVDLDAYKPRQIERRITALLCRAGQRNLTDFAGLIETDPRRLADFVDGITINVSEFFRNPEKWEELEAEVLPALLNRFETIKIWSAGCSMGAELYSMGILLDEMGALDRAELVGSDLDRGSLQQAEAAIYGAHEVKPVSPERLARYFKPEGQRFRFDCARIQARTTFKRTNLLVDPPETGCHLVLCRNVVIYLNETGKLHLYRSFHDALVPGGLLFVGGTERIFAYRELGYEQASPFFYRRPDARSH